MDPIWNIVLNAMIFLAIIIIGCIQGAQIKTLKSSLSAQKSILDAVKIYFEIFKVDEIKKYVALSEESSKLEAKRQIEAITHQMSEQLKKQSVQSNEILIDLYGLIYALLVRIPQKARVQLVNENLKNPGSRAMMTLYLSQTKDIYLPPPNLTLLDLFLSEKSLEYQDRTLIE